MTSDIDWNQVAAKAKGAFDVDPLLACKVVCVATFSGKIYTGIKPNSYVARADLLPKLEGDLRAQYPHTYFSDWISYLWVLRL